MSTEVIEVGDKLHIITRRLFEGDIRRHFVGEVIGRSGELHELNGYAFVFNSGTNEYRKRPHPRRRIFSLGDAGLIVTRVPRETSVETVDYRFVDKRLVVTDGRGFTLDINEFGPTT